MSIWHNHSICISCLPRHMCCVCIWSRKFVYLHNTMPLHGNTLNIAWWLLKKLWAGDYKFYCILKIFSSIDQALLTISNFFYTYNNIIIITIMYDLIYHTYITFLNNDHVDSISEVCTNLLNLSSLKWLSTSKKDITKFRGTVYSWSTSGKAVCEQYSWTTKTACGIWNSINANRYMAGIQKSFE